LLYAIAVTGSFALCSGGAVADSPSAGSRVDRATPPQILSSSIQRTFKNTTGFKHNDLHITFNGPVDANTGVSGSYAPFLDKTNAGTNTIKFSNGSVDADGSVGCLTFSSTADNLAITSAKWSDDGVEGSDATVQSCAIKPVPALDPRGIALMVAALVLIGGFVLMRRRRVAH
jgi:hypothetical protein